LDSEWFANAANTRPRTANRQREAFKGGRLREQCMGLV
jgi:hypothetical protein